MNGASALCRLVHIRPGLDNVTIRPQLGMGGIAQRKTRQRKNDCVKRERVTVGAALFCRVSISQTHAWSLINVSSAMVWHHVSSENTHIRNRLMKDMYCSVLGGLISAIENSETNN